MNPAAGQKMNAGEMAVDLVPQGTFVERIRCGGAGLGGVLTPTGVGTAIEKDKKIIKVDGRDFLLETPLKADFGFIKASVCDKLGNGSMDKATKNFNVAMAMAAQHSILETEKLVEVGQLDPDRVTLPGVFVNAIACGRGQ
jgi:acetate CoA/acetoacetate CoA-transferase alpha subunit